MMSPAGTPLPIGPRLRAARSEQHLSLRALAEQTGFSASFLSQVELGQASPSLHSLDRIARALGADLAGLLSPPSAANGPVVQRGRGPGVRSEWSRATVRSLLPAGAAERVSILLIALDPGGRTGKEGRGTAGRELGFCARGRVTLLLDGQRHQLRRGDSIFYDAGQADVWLNESTRPVEILLVTLGRERAGR